MNIKKMFKKRSKKTKILKTCMVGNSEHKMALKSRDMGEGRYEVNGVVFYAESHVDALRKYRRERKDSHGQ